MSGEDPPWGRERARGELEEVTDGSHGADGPWVHMKPCERRAELQWKGRLGGRYHSRQRAEAARKSVHSHEKERERWHGSKGRSSKGRQGSGKWACTWSRAALRSLAVGLCEAFPAQPVPRDLSSLGSTNCHIRERPEHNAHHSLMS